jgi:hypothetical protein
MLRKIISFLVDTEVLPGVVEESPKEAVKESKSSLKYFSLFLFPSDVSNENPYPYLVDVEAGPYENEKVTVKPGYQRFETGTPVYVKRNLYFRGAVKGEHRMEMINPRLIEARSAKENSDAVNFAKQHLVKASKNRA